MSVCLRPLSGARLAPEAPSQYWGAMNTDATDTQLVVDFVRRLRRVVLHPLALRHSVTGRVMRR